MTGRPTQQDLDNAATRQAIADRFRREFLEAVALAESAFGAGWEPTGHHDLIAHSEAERCRRTGERPKSAAIVYTARKGDECRHFMLVDGQAQEVASYEQGFGAMLTEPDPERTAQIGGKTVHLHRYGLYFSGYEPGYAPKTAEQLAEARVKREAKKVEKMADEHPLFADAIRKGDWRPGRSR